MYWLLLLIPVSLLLWKFKISVKIEPRRKYIPDFNPQDYPYEVITYMGLFMPEMIAEKVDRFGFCLVISHKNRLDEIKDDLGGYRLLQFKTTKDIVSRIFLGFFVKEDSDLGLEDILPQVNKIPKSLCKIPFSDLGFLGNYKILTFRKFMNYGTSIYGYFVQDDDKIHKVEKILIEN